MSTPECFALFVLPAHCLPPCFENHQEPERKRISSPFLSVVSLFENACQCTLPHMHSLSLFLSGSCLFQCPDKFLRGLEAGIVNCQISYPALIPLSKILSNIKSCEIGGRFLIILITAFLSLLKRARRNRFRSGNYPCGPVPDSRSALEPVPATDGRHQGGLLLVGAPRTGDASWEGMS